MHLVYEWHSSGRKVVFHNFFRDQTNLIWFVLLVTQGQEEILTHALYSRMGDGRGKDPHYV